MDRRRLLLVAAAVIAALGVALVFVYARGADARAAERFDAVEVLTATQQIAPGESVDDALTAGKVTLTRVAKAQMLEGAGKDAGPLRGKVALTTIYPGEQLVPVKFGGADQVEAAAVLPIPAGKLAISISVEDDARVGAFIRAGAEVAIILTRPKDGAPIESRVLLDRVTVLADGVRTSVPDGATDAGSGNAAEDATLGRLITVAVSQRDAEKVRFAERDGNLSIALLNDGSTVKRDDGVSGTNLFK